MAARPCGRGPPLLHLLLLALLALLAGGSEACTVDECSHKFRDVLSAPPSGDTPDAKVCAVLHRYRDCVHSRAGACHGNLGYHSALTIVRRRMQVNRCGAATSPRPQAPTRRPLPLGPLPPPDAGPVDTEDGEDYDPMAPTAPPPAPAPDDPACEYTGPARHVHCGLFGDPHLKTFANKHQTCRVQGAWPLIDNPHLAVQVTNKHVLEGSRATATTKVTVSVRSVGHAACSKHRKTYEATADAPLPATFVDGTQRSPGGNVQLSVFEEGRRVEILVRHVDTLVVVRRAGRYLAFSARLPEQVALAGHTNSGLQLCARGCPAIEQLDPQEERGHAMRLADAERVCGASNLTGAYHDWCVFDLMTTGADDFAEAAHAALTDVRRLDPESAPTAVSDQGSGAASRSGRGHRAGALPGSGTAWLPASRLAAIVALVAVAVR